MILNPSTPVAFLEDILWDVDWVMIMSVNLGFWGQKFIPNAVNRIISLKQMIVKRKLMVKIEVDGVITLNNVAQICQAGADIIVAGSGHLSYSGL